MVKSEPRIIFCNKCHRELGPFYSKREADNAKREHNRTNCGTGRHGHFALDEMLSGRNNYSGLLP